MCKTTILALATAMALASGATAAPVIPIVPKHVAGAVERTVRPGDGALILVQNRTRGGGGQRAGGAQRAGGGAGGANRGSFNSSDFHRNASNTQTRNASSSRNTNVNANRNVNVSGGGCCYGDYNSGPSWGGVAAGVAVGAVVGAAATSAASSPTYVAPPPTYPPGYVSPPPY
jgi:hypothetical protein